MTLTLEHVLAALLVVLAFLLARMLFKHDDVRKSLIASAVVIVFMVASTLGSVAIVKAQQDPKISTLLKDRIAYILELGYGPPFPTAK